MNPVTVLFMCKVCRSSFKKIAQFIEHKQQAHSREFQNISCIIFEEKILLKDLGYNVDQGHTSSFSESKATTDQIPEIPCAASKRRFEEDEEPYGLDSKCRLQETPIYNEQFYTHESVSASELNNYQEFQSQNEDFPDINLPNPFFNTGPRASELEEATAKTNMYFINTTDDNNNMHPLDASVKQERVEYEGDDSGDAYNNVNTFPLRFSNSIFHSSNSSCHAEADFFNGVEFRQQYRALEENSVIQNVKMENSSAVSDEELNLHLNSNTESEIDDDSNNNDDNRFAVSWPDFCPLQDSNHTDSAQFHCNFNAETGIESPNTLQEVRGFSAASFDSSSFNSADSSTDVKIESEYFETNNSKFADDYHGDEINEGDQMISRSFSQIFCDEQISKRREEGELNHTGFDVRLLSFPIVSSEIVSTLFDSTSMSISVPPDEKLTIRCSLCTKDRYYSEDPKCKRKHMLKFHPDLKMQCPSCRVENLFWESELEKHIAIKHNTDLLNFACERCSQCMTSLRGLRRHQTLCEKKKLLPEFEEAVDHN